MPRIDVQSQDVIDYYGLTKEEREQPLDLCRECFNDWNGDKLTKDDN